MKRKGLTLIEIVVALTLITFITVVFMTFLSNSINHIIKTHDYADDKLNVQGELTDKIEELKKVLYNDMTPAGYETKTIQNAFQNRFGRGVDIEYIQLKYPSTGAQNVQPNHQTYYYLIGKYKKEIPQEPILTKVDVDIKRDNTVFNTTYASKYTSLNGMVTEDSGTRSYLLQTLYNWYASKVGFNIPAYNATDEEKKNSSLFPDLQTHYVHLKNEKNKSISNTENLGGMHIILSATPVSKDKIYGDTVRSEAKYLYNLPVDIEKINLFLDASLIDIHDRRSVQTRNGLRRVTMWKDLNDNTIFARERRILKAPILEQRNNNPDIRSRYVTFNNSTALRFSGIANDDVHVFAVAYGDTFTPLYSDGWDIYTLDGDIINAENSFDQSNDKYWYLHHQEVDSNGVFWFGGGDIKIAEFLVCSDDLTQSEIISIKEYLKMKYRPFLTASQVLAIEDVEQIIEQDSAYTMPKALVATLPNNKYSMVPVEFNEVLTSDQVMKKTITGHLLNNPSITFKYTLIVE